ncbi:MAG TPA: hypothetical protein VK217_07730, partial [Acidimicrobiales bacterium]|nr:hypothetical protein [Acidimicrobiales bacterium]
ALDSLGRGEQAIARIRDALASIDETKAPPEVVADLQSSLARALAFSGHGDEAVGPIEQALTLAQHYELAEPLTFSLNSKAALLMWAGRIEEARSAFELVISLARRHGITEREMIAEGNLAEMCMTLDLPGAEEHAEAALALARRWGLREQEAWAAGLLTYSLTMAGHLDEASRLWTELLQEGGDLPRFGGQWPLAHLETLRGNLEGARKHVVALSAWSESDDIQEKSAYGAIDAAVSHLGGDSPHALETARRAIDEAIGGGIGVAHEAVRIAFPVAIDAALDIDDLEEADRLANVLAERPRGEVPPFLRAEVTRAKALVSSARGDDGDVEESLVAAESTLRDLGYPYWTARAQLDRAEWLAGRDRWSEAARLAGEAAATFERLGTEPMLARAQAVSMATVDAR